MYAAVLYLYVEANMYVRVRAPTKETVFKLINQIDVDSSGHLNYDEFKQIMMVLSRQVLGRAVTQTVFTLSCPLIAGLSVRVMVETIDESFEDPWQTLPKYMRLIPRTVPATILSTVLMLMMPFIFKIIDDRSLREADKRAEKLASKTD